MSIAWIAVTITFLVGMIGFATDAGMLFVTRARLQNTVDASVLAAAQELPATGGATTTYVTSVACDYVARNAVTGMRGTPGSAACGGKADVTFPASTQVRVTAYRTVQPTFGRLIGFRTVNVGATASAQIGSLGAACVFPFFLTIGQLSNPSFFAPVVFSNANTSGGAIDVGGGASGIRDAMVSRSCSSQSAVNNAVTTKPGALDQFKAGWETISTSAASSACPDHRLPTYLVAQPDGRQELSTSVTLANCPRLVIVPVLQNGNYSSGGVSFPILGYIPFYFSRICGSTSCTYAETGSTTLSRNDFWGYFVRIDVTADKYTSYDDRFGTRVVALGQ